MKIYHATKKWDGENLESLASQIGEFDAIEEYTKKWPDAGELAAYHVHYVHCFKDLGDAEEFANEIDGEVVEIDFEDFFEDFVEIDNLEFPHPVVRDEIPAEYISRV